MLAAAGPTAHDVKPGAVDDGQQRNGAESFVGAWR